MSMSSRRLKVSVGLVHHPVMNKEGKIVTTSVTTIDVHDFSRLCKTYDIDGFYVVTPLASQRRLTDRLMRHWIDGHGGKYNPSRKEALSVVKVVDSVDEIYNNIKFSGGVRPLTVVTSAIGDPKAIGYENAKERLKDFDEVLILFGTGYGLANEITEKADVRLEPIEGLGTFNHLSVRCAAAIILDRLFSESN